MKEEPQYGKNPVVMVDEVMSSSPPKFNFPEAGLRIMITNKFGPRTRLRMASRIIINEVGLLQGPGERVAPEGLLVLGGGPGLSGRCLGLGRRGELGQAGVGTAPVSGRKPEHHCKQQTANDPAGGGGRF